MTAKENTPGDNFIAGLARVAIYVLAFAIPAVVLSLLFPDKANKIFLVALYVFFAFSTMMVGASWSDPSYTPMVRIWAIAILLAVALVNPILRFITIGDAEPVALLITIAERLAYVFAPFFLGRGLYWLTQRQMRMFDDKDKS